MADEPPPPTDVDGLDGDGLDDDGLLGWRAYISTQWAVNIIVRSCSSSGSGWQCPPLTSVRNAGRAAQVGIIVPLMFGIITQRIRRRPSKLIPGRRCERPPAGRLRCRCRCARQLTDAAYVQDTAGDLAPR